MQLTEFKAVGMQVLMHACRHKDGRGPSSHPPTYVMNIPLQMQHENAGFWKANQNIYLFIALSNSVLCFGIGGFCRQIEICEIRHITPTRMLKGPYVWIGATIQSGQRSTVIQ